MPASREDVTRAAAAVLLRGERLDTGVLASRLGISRATLFRHGGNREALLAEALWRLASLTLRRASAAGDRAAADDAAAADGDQVQAAGDQDPVEGDQDPLEGDPVPTVAERLPCLGVMEEFRRVVAGSTAVQHLLAEEPVLALRLLTDPRGRVQPRLVEAYTELLQRDVDALGLTPLVPLPMLAFSVVRLGESFLYADVLAAREVDLDTATTVLDAFVTSVLVPPVLLGA